MVVEQERMTKDAVESLPAPTEERLQTILLEREAKRDSEYGRR